VLGLITGFPWCQCDRPDREGPRYERLAAENARAAAAAAAGVAGASLVAARVAGGGGGGRAFVLFAAAVPAQSPVPARGVAKTLKRARRDVIVRHPAARQRMTEAAAKAEADAAFGPADGRAKRASASGFSAAYGERGEDGGNDVPAGGAAAAAPAAARRRSLPGIGVCPHCGEDWASVARLTEHIAHRHGIGRFWPCPLLGDPLPATRFLPAEPCAHQPWPTKNAVRTHVVTRHGKSHEEVSALLAALAPIVRTAPAADAAEEDGEERGEAEGADEDEDEDKDVEIVEACPLKGHARKHKTLGYRLCDFAGTRGQVLAHLRGISHPHFKALGSRAHRTLTTRLVTGEEAAPAPPAHPLLFEPPSREHINAEVRRKILLPQLHEHELELVESVAEAATRPLCSVCGLAELARSFECGACAGAKAYAECEWCVRLRSAAAGAGDGADARAGAGAGAGAGEGAGAGASAAGGATRDSFATMSRTMLARACGARGLDAEGEKSELRKRLRAYDRKKARAAAAAADEGAGDDGAAVEAEAGDDAGAAEAPAAASDAASDAAPISDV